jgi:long-chain acyl-CoA synthetase
MSKRSDLITLDDVNTLSGAFRERLARTPDAVAYLQFDRATEEWRSYTWAQTAADVAKYQVALLAEGFEAGDRVGIMMQNRREWVLFDQAALGLGLVVVPLYANDRAENVGYILQNAGVRLVLIEDDAQWRGLHAVKSALDALQRVLILEPSADAALPGNTLAVADWLPAGEHELRAADGAPDALCSIVFTSGTTGRPKGVMLSHTNILFNAAGCTRMVEVVPDDRFLSFLPLSHMLERTIGYYLPILAGAEVAFARSIKELADDLRVMRPTIIVAVPRIFERVHRAIHAKLEEGPSLQRRLFALAVSTGWCHFEKQQGRRGWGGGPLRGLLDRLVAEKVRQRFGGRLRFAVCGGAALSPEIAQVFLGLGIPLLQGYGLTETSPVITANTLEDNIPASVGMSLPGVEIRIGESDALFTRSPSVMLGYWDNREATEQILDPDGWLNTGDRARRSCLHHRPP